MTAIHLATPDDLSKLEPMIAAYHAFEGVETTTEQRKTAITPLLDGTPHGMVYILGPRVSPIGYIAISLGWSIELGGLDAFIDEFYIRETVRGRGVGTEVLISLMPALERHGVKALHLEVDRNNDRAKRLYLKAGFKLRDKYALMTRIAR